MAVSSFMRGEKMANRGLYGLRGRYGMAMAVLAVCAALSGCGGSETSSPFSGGLFGSSKQDDNAGEKAGWGATVTEANMLAAARDGQGASDVTGSVGARCPSFTVAPGSGDVTMRAPGSTAPNDTMAVMHRGEITKIARECAVGARGVAVKYGFAGRVLLGPQGKTGNLTLAVKVTVVDDMRKTVKTEVLKVPVTVPADDTVGYFSVVREIMVPVAQGMTPQSYKVNVAFDRSVPGAS